MSNERQEQETQELLTELEIIFDSLGKGETGADNLGASTGFNTSLFFGWDTLWFMGPAVSLGIIYGVFHWWIERRYRDSWDAYLVRERDRLDRINHLLDSIKLDELNQNNVDVKNLGSRLKNLLEKYINDTKDLYKRLIDEKYQNTLGIPYQIQPETQDDNVVELEEIDDNKVIELEKTSNLTKTKTEPNLLLALLGEERYKKYLALTSPQADQGDQDNSASKQEHKKPILTELENKKKDLQDRLEDFDVHFVNGYLFNVVLSYGLAYWLVNYYSTAAIAGALTTTPLGWALLALVFPVIYLLYKEFVTYRTRLIAKEDSPEQLNFRRGWIFVGLILGVTLAIILPPLGLSTLASIGIGAAAFAGVIGTTAIAGHAIDRHVDNLRNLNASKTTQAAETSNTIKALLARKEHAKLRREMLDEIALVTLELTHQSKLKKQGEEYTQATNDVFKTELKYVGETMIKPPVPPSQESVSSAEREPTLTEKIRLVLNVGLSGLLGYALGSLIGFCLLDFLGHVSAIFLGDWMYGIWGLISLAIGGMFATRAYYTEKMQQNDLSIISAKGNFLQKQEEIKTLDNEILNAKQQLEIFENTKKQAIARIKKDPSNINNLASLNKLKQLKPDFQFVHPVKNEGVTKRKFFFVIRSFLQTIISVSSASLFIRALLLMGFAKLVPGVIGSSLLIVGATTGPLGFIVLGLAIAVFLIKAIYDVYLAYHHQREMEKIEHADFDIQCKTAERDYLQAQIKIMTPTNELMAAVLKQPLSEAPESHSVLSNTPAPQRPPISPSNEQTPAPKENP